MKMFFTLTSFTVHFKHWMQLWPNRNTKFVQKRWTELTCWKIFISCLLLVQYVFFSSKLARRIFGWVIRWIFLKLCDLPNFKFVCLFFFLFVLTDRSYPIYWHLRNSEVVLSILEGLPLSYHFVIIVISFC